jgi:hypothetical protein
MFRILGFDLSLNIGTPSYSRYRLVDLLTQSTHRLLLIHNLSSLIFNVLVLSSSSHRISLRYPLHASREMSNDYPVTKSQVCQVCVSRLIALLAP